MATTIYAHETELVVCPFVTDGPGPICCAGAQAHQRVSVFEIYYIKQLVSNGEKYIIIFLYLKYLGFHNYEVTLN